MLTLRVRTRDLQPLAFKLDIDPAQQHLVELGRRQPVAEAAAGNAAVAGLQAGEHHEVHPNQITDWKN